MVSAVLNAVGKRYLVETGLNDSGSHYEVYSDGFCIQYGLFNKTDRVTSIPLPIEFKDTNYVALGINNISNSSSGSCWVGIGNKTTTSFDLRLELANGSSAIGLRAWFAIGYVN